MTTTKMDLAVSDVQQPGPLGGSTKRRKKRPRARLRMKHPQHGTIEIDMTIKNAFGELVALGDGSAATDEPKWVHIAKPGKFLGHAAGPFEMNDQTFAEIIRNFRANPEEIPFDFEHASEADPSTGSIPHMGAPAQGWVKDLRVENGQLYGLVEWGELARQYIREKKYRHVSPAIRFGSRDRVTGKAIGARLSSVALTNRPFLSGLQPIAATHQESPMANERDNDDDRELAIELGQEKAKAAELQAKLTEATTKLSTMETRAVAAEGKASTLESEVVTLRNDAKERKDREVAQVVDEAIATYKDTSLKGFTPEKRQHLLSWASSDLSGFQVMYPKVTAGQAHLMRDISGGREERAPGANVSTTANSGGKVVTLSDVARRIAAEKRIPLAIAQQEAVRIMAKNAR